MAVRVRNDAEQRRNGDYHHRIPDSPRIALLKRSTERELSLAALSAKIGHNSAYLRRYVNRGTPRRLPEEERLHLAIALEIDERELGARDPWRPAL